MTGADLVIFDCDGVLIDSEILACRIDAELLTALGYAITPDEAAARFCGVPAEAMRAEIERDWGRPLPPDFERTSRRRTEGAYRRGLRAVPGIADLLAGLGRPRCVASSSVPERLRLGLSLTGLLPLLEPHVFSTTMVANGKPAPDLFLHAARAMGAAPARCVVVEDSVPGIRAGVAAGMGVIGFTAGAHCPPGHGARLRAAGAAEIAPDAGTLHRLLT